jgi:hypothetical protein
MPSVVYITDSHGGGIFLNVDPDTGDCLECGKRTYNHSFADALNCEQIVVKDISDDRREFLRKLYELHPESPGRKV